MPASLPQQSDTTAVSYGGVWVSFYPDMSGLSVFATPDEAYADSLDKSAWVVFLAYGVNIAELLEQVRATAPGGP